MPLTIEQFKQQVEEEMNKIGDIPKDERDTYVIIELTHRIISLTADFMTGEMLVPKGLAPSWIKYDVRIEEERALAEEIKSIK